MIYSNLFPVETDDAAASIDDIFIDHDLCARVYGFIRPVKVTVSRQGVILPTRLTDLGPTELGLGAALLRNLYEASYTLS